MFNKAKVIKDKRQKLYKPINTFLKTDLAKLFKDCVQGVFLNGQKERGPKRSNAGSIFLIVSYQETLFTTNSLVVVCSPYYDVLEM